MSHQRKLSFIFETKLSYVITVLFVTQLYDRSRLDGDWESFDLNAV